mmetsp:Transcript_32811/g.50197  ORF Transcript_32811/g.50197 Transcript_32811/m.50197 type:complete len:86 (+) Transcript_32811:290-547(+)
MPDMGEGGGKVLTWFKKEGDIVQKDDVLCDIETDDFSFGMSTDDLEPAIMGEILVPAGGYPVRDGTILCYLWHKEDDDDDETKVE